MPFFIGRGARIPSPLAGKPKGVRWGKAVLSLFPLHPLAPDFIDVVSKSGALFCWLGCSDCRLIGLEAKGRSVGESGAFPFFASPLP